MKVALSADMGWRTLTEHFTSPTQFGVLFADSDAAMSATMVGHFSDGATTLWPRHDGPQLLVVLNGEARICRDGDEPVVLERGDAVLCAPGERHWHGAGEGRDAAVLSLTWGETVWEEVAP
jgi:quercetin dioxygenase-like cupin family protein